MLLFFLDFFCCEVFEAKQKRSHIHNSHIWKLEASQVKCAKASSSSLSLSLSSLSLSFSLSFLFLFQSLSPSLSLALALSRSLSHTHTRTQTHLEARGLPREVCKGV